MIPIWVLFGNAECFTLLSNSYIFPLDEKFTSGTVIRRNVCRLSSSFAPSLSLLNLSMRTKNNVSSLLGLEGDDSSFVFYTERWLQFCFLYGNKVWHFWAIVAFRLDEKLTSGTNCGTRKDIRQNVYRLSSHPHFLSWFNQCLVTRVSAAC